jgi:hypothetical protein
MGKVDTAYRIANTVDMASINTNVQSTERRNFALICQPFCHAVQRDGK